MNGLLIPGTNSNGSIQTQTTTTTAPPPPPIPTQLFSNLNINNNNETTTTTVIPPPPPLIAGNHGSNQEQFKNLKPIQRNNEEGSSNQKFTSNGTINGGGLDFLTEIRQRIQKKNFQQQHQDEQQQQNENKQEDSDGSYKPSNIKKLNSNIPQKTNDSPKPLKK